MVYVSPSAPARLSSEPSTSLEELRVLLHKRSKNQHDRIVDVAELYMDEANGDLCLGKQRLALSDLSLGQLAAKLGIPAGYLKRCDPELRAGNMNRWLSV